MFPANCIRVFLLFITASCSFTCVCLQTAVLHAASRLTWTCVWWLSSLTGVQCDTVISRHAHTLTGCLNTVRRRTRLFIDNLESRANRAGVKPECVSLSEQVSTITDPISFPTKGGQVASKSYIEKTGFERSAGQILTMMTKFS